MRLSEARVAVVGLAVALSGCITDSTIDLIAADPGFEPKAPVGTAPMPAYRVGDIFRYQVGASLVAEKVERIDGDGVWWRDNLGRRWVGSEGALIPTHAVGQADGKAQIVKANIQAIGQMFPLAVGKTVAFRSTRQNWLNGQTTQERSCTVEEFGALKIAAGVFDAFRVKCFYNGDVRFNYYAPAVGRVVLQTTDTILDSVQRELVGFERGLDKSLRTAAGPMEKAPGGKANPKPAKFTAGAEIRYGIQLAAYRSPTRAKKAWSWIKRRGGPLLADFEPRYERAENSGGTLFRLVVGDFAKKTQARRHCQALKRNGIDCWPRIHGGNAKPGPVAATAPSNGLRVVSR